MRRLLTMFAVVAVAVAVVGAPATAAGWAIVPTPNPGTTNSLNGIVSLSSTSTEIWAVGSASSPSYSGCHGRTLAVRSTGGAFSEVPSTPTSICAAVNGVAGTSTSDLWAVGSANSARDTHIRHWNGSVWSVVPGATLTPPPAGARRLRTTGLNGVSAVSPTFALAVGKAEYSDSSRRTLAERWDGTAWRLQSAPGGSGSELDAVDAINPSYAWAVGADGTGKTLAMRWNGMTWIATPTVSPDVLNTLRGVSARTASDVWAVGDSIKSTTDGVSAGHTLIEHWNGTAWSVVPSPNVGTGSNSLIAVDARSATDAWAVGSWTDTSADIPVLRPLVLHWNGSTWSRVVAPSSGTSDSWLTSVVAPTGRTDAWASGTSYAGTLVEHFS